MPQPLTSFCANSNFIDCRVYQSFLNHRYYLVAKSNLHTNIMTFSGTVIFTASRDNSASYYNSYYAWSIAGYYYDVYNSVFNKAYISDSSKALAYIPTMYGNDLATYPTSFIFTINANGFTLYSNKLTYGQQKSSFIRLTLTGFTSLFGCGVSLSNRVRSFTSPFYCEVKSVTSL
jgi:hypothetical protein